MSLYPDRDRCPACDLLVVGAWNDNARCKCDDASREAWLGQRPIASAYDDNRQLDVALMAWRKREPR